MGRRSQKSANANREGGAAGEEEATHKPRKSKSGRTGSKGGRPRTRDQEEPCSSSRAEAEREARRRRKKMRGTPIGHCVSNADATATAKIMKQVKYYFNSMKLEQSFIDAYANDGWKGQSREKVRPEKELERATAKILGWKLKIRKAVQELDKMCLEGSILDSAFDADGQLDYQEIFCAKCHSHEAEVDNDIILCDGFCNRGFHQKCLNPPLATEDIPPGDEGWMCPICDCKSDCASFLNDHLGTDFDVEMSWEKFFPEAVEGSNTIVADDAVQDLPSEDSDDDDYDPDNKDKEQEKLANGKGAKANEAGEEQDQAGDDDDESDDSGGDDSGGGDGSDSDDGTTDLSGEEPLSAAEEDEDEKEKEGDEEGGGSKKDSDEVSGKRRRRDVDYRKLHDEMFGVEYEWAEAFQSEDEDYGPLKRPRKQRSERKTDRNEQNQDHGENQDGFSDKSKRIPPEAVQRLRVAFDRDQLPSRDSKEAIAKELGLSYRKVDVWFKNVRTQALKKAKSDEAENQTLLTQVGQAELKLEDLKRAMEAVRHLEVLKLSSYAQGFYENSVVDVNRGKRLVYMPVAEVVEQGGTNPL
ncbi:hypothetical protein SELMODRAFT_438630 [Selaginella moellendorffii]|uniref:Uncharacterized protein n=1 Tax=Selaginella moellendorffii TaxID=88036 RepID=D8QX61_SELML|nr:homeobox protein HAT3.1 [Selaginella moellendorffii]EFJ35354.1 hypothetical protein SELMODRAFT_438630 [Selaginella moellendorffii]|eukprot:XP_002963483.1 homeobox protein HAT3.1 [Selaginella moellendorffii]